MFIIHRDSLPAIDSVTVDGRTHKLGLLKDLRRDPRFARWVPDVAELSMSWVHLEPDEQLDPHCHPTTSAIVVTEGRGRVLGDLEQPIAAGDVVLVPPGATHGFVGAEPAGFWGLSLQFEGRALYADLERPRVAFVEEPAASRPLDRLLERQSFWLERFGRHPLVTLARSERAREPAVRARLLDGLQFWSNQFQRILCVRAALQSSPPIQGLAEQHLMEEVGHHRVLAGTRGDRPPLWDAQLAAPAAWFFEQMTSRDQDVQVVLMHFVLEGSGSVFHDAAASILHDHPYFQLHREVDQDHFQLGVEVLRGLPRLDVDKLRTALDHGWQVMSALCQRLADMALAADG